MAPITNIENAFRLTMCTYQHPQETRTFCAPATEPSLDPPVPVLHISGPDNYSLPRPNLRIKPIDTTAKATPSQHPILHKLILHMETQAINICLALSLGVDY